MNIVGRVLVAAAVAGATLAACGGGSEVTAVMRNQQAGQGIAVGEPNGGVPVVSEYIKLAQAAACASTRNHLYLVDSKYVLWDRAGECADNAYGQTLMGATPQAVLCTAGDSIAGPRTSCTDASMRTLFDTMRGNLDKADLGLGAGHKVEQIRFLPASGTPIGFSQVVSADFSHIGAAREVVVKDAAAWAALWAEHSKSGSAAPQFDFSNQMLLAVFAGEANSGCASFDVVYVGSRDGKMIVEYEQRALGPATPCLPVVTQPMRVVAVPRVEAPVAFRKIVSGHVNFVSVEPLLRTQVTQARNVVVRDQAAWATLWAEHAGKDTPVPTIDFARQMVIGVFRGAQPDGCRSTAIREVRFDQGRLNVVHVDTVPGPGIMCTMAIVYPAHLIVVHRSDAAVEFIQEIRTLQ